MLIPQAIVQTGGSSSREFLALKVYAPVGTTVLSTTSATFADVDATNAVVTFTAPSSGNVLLRSSVWVDDSATTDCFLGIRDGTTDVAGTVTRVQRTVTDQQYLSVPMYVSGLTPGNSYTYKLSFAVTGGGTFRLIMEDGSVATTKWGPLIMEVWAAP